MDGCMMIGPRPVVTSCVTSRNVPLVSMPPTLVAIGNVLGTLSPEESFGFAEIGIALLSLREMVIVYNRHFGLFVII